MKIHVRAPATTANIGPGFDCVAAALDLWNELEVEEGGGELDESHLGVQAFSRLVPVAGKHFEFTSRIPRERGLGSSAAVIALGLVAGASPPESASARCASASCAGSTIRMADAAVPARLAACAATKRGSVPSSPKPSA